MSSTLMRRVFGAAVLALSLAPPVHAAPAATTVLWPAYANVVVTGVAPDRMPEWRIETIEARDGTGVVDVSPEWNCQSRWEPKLRFDLSCQPVAPPTPIVLGNQVINRAWNCQNPAVRAEIAGPGQGESVTGTVACTRSAASCTASATTPSLAAGGWQGVCVQNAPASPPPVRCFVDLTKVFIDRWEVTCYTSDP